MYDITLLLSEIPSQDWLHCSTSQHEQALSAGNQQILQDDLQETEGKGEQKTVTENQHDEAAPGDEDPETRLRRSVLINNTFRTLQLEHRESVRQEQLESLRRKRSSDCLTISPVEQTQPKIMHLSQSAESRAENVTAEDILSDVILPPPLNPSLSHVVVENYKVIDCYTGASMEGTSLPPPWMEKEYFDWAQISEEEQKIWQDDDDDGDGDTNTELNASMQDTVNSDTMNEDEGYDEFSDSSSEDDDSPEYDTTLAEGDSDLVLCRLDTVTAVKSAPHTSSPFPNLMTPLET